MCFYNLSFVMSLFSRKQYSKNVLGTLSTINPDIDVAKPGVDFTFSEDTPYVLFDDGLTSAPIVMNITDDDIPELVEIFHINITRAVLIDLNGVDVQPPLPPQIGLFSNAFF